MSWTYQSEEVAEIFKDPPKDAAGFLNQTVRFLALSHKFPPISMAEELPASGENMHPVFHWERVEGPPEVVGVRVGKGEAQDAIIVKASFVQWAFDEHKKTNNDHLYGALMGTMGYPIIR